MLSGNGRKYHVGQFPRFHLNRYCGVFGTSVLNLPTGAPWFLGSVAVSVWHGGCETGALVGNTEWLWSSRECRGAYGGAGFAHQQARQRSSGGPRVAELGFRTDQFYHHVPDSNSVRLNDPCAMSSLFHVAALAPAPSPLTPAIGRIPSELMLKGHSTKSWHVYSISERRTVANPTSYLRKAGCFTHSPAVSDRFLLIRLN